MTIDVRPLVSAALGVEALTATRVGGGDFASSHRVALADGSVVFAKSHRNPPPGFFTTEAAGLAWLASGGAGRVPEVLHAGDTPPLLVLEWIEESRTAAPDEAAFGQALALLHAERFECFGRPDARTTGSQALPNEPAESWAGFLAEQRLLPLARIAHDQRSLPAPSIKRIESLAARLDHVVPPPEPPSLLHGDLWAGNRVVDTAGRSWLIDPACFGGHREFDLAMMRLFGGFGDAAFAAYHEAHPLADGWADRVSLHQLPPLIVHAIKFGGRYPAAVDRALDHPRPGHP